MKNRGYLKDIGSTLRYCSVFLKDKADNFHFLQPEPNAQLAERLKAIIREVESYLRQLNQTIRELEKETEEDQSV